MYYFVLNDDNDLGKFADLMKSVVIYANAIYFFVFGMNRLSCVLIVLVLLIDYLREVSLGLRNIEAS